MNVSIDFFRNVEYTVSALNSATEAIEYSKIKGVIFSNECLFDIAFELMVKNDGKNDIRIWNYSLILSSIAIVEIYLTLKLIYSVSENNVMGKNVILY